MFLAAAAFWLYKLLEVFFSIVVGEFGPGFNVLTGKDEYFFAGSDGFAIRRARVIDVSGEVGGDIPINRFLCVHLKEIFTPAFIGHFIAHHAASVFDDARTFGDVFFGKKPLAG